MSGSARASRRRLSPAGLFGLIAVVLALPVAMMLLMASGTGTATERLWPDPRLLSCLLTGSFAALLSAWLFALQPREVAVRLFAASGLATYGFCLGAAVFLLPVDLSPETLAQAGMLNVFAASGFGLAMIALFALYPRPLRSSRWIIGTSVIIFPIWTLMGWFGPFEPFVEIHRITLVEMAVILLLAGVQVRAARHDPVDRAIALWLGASVIIGAGGFIALVALPSALLKAPFIAHEYGFGLFSIIYAALTVALLRYRVFGLGRWAFQLLFLAAAVLSVLLIDGVMIVWLALDPARATGITLLLIALTYLPARNYLWVKLVGRRQKDEAELFRAVADVALAPTATERIEAWRQLLTQTFAPLSIMPAPIEVGDVVIDEEGRSLLVPGSDGLPRLAMRDPHAGRSLFSPTDARMVSEMLALITYLSEARGAYDRGVASERARIAQDIHDNIGAQLLTALHASGGERKNELIRETIGDLRDVIRNADAEEQSLATLLADLRIETADRVELAGLTLTWESADFPAIQPRRDTLRALRSFVREAVSNTLRHAEASHIAIVVTARGKQLSLEIIDDGKGFDAAIARAGHGLGNMRGRIEGLGGSFALVSGSDGTSISARLPLTP
ncbi:sensor histidine kinase [Porphyrobacter sp. HT-58-2]|uniref:sensor histidine kinase n=1 Tax=Porphyrobacter sp. HT-58-2 TaxID=2023229 RepID=UPI0015593091|nr:ATP-binding protein [Porphyrobacter sp. HT-58-2]